MNKDQAKDAPRGLSGHQLAVAMAAAKKVMASSQSPKVSYDSPGPRFNRAIATLRKYGAKT
jgi:hypothetical protein